MAAEALHHRDLCISAIRLAQAGPNARERDEAPRIEHWCIMLSPHGRPVLWGKVIDHPRLGTIFMATSRLVALDRQAGWARSLTGWFRLGSPFAPTAADLRRGYPRSVAGRALEDVDACGFTALDDSEDLSVILIGLVWS